MKLVRSVVMDVTMVELAKTTSLVVPIRSKIFEKGSTDWVGWIIGARCIDCPQRQGLGFIPLEHAHSFTAFGIMMKRTERSGGPKPDKCYAVRSSVLDSDDDVSSWRAKQKDVGALSQTCEPRQVPVAVAEGRKKS